MISRCVTTAAAVLLFAALPGGAFSVQQKPDSRASARRVAKAERAAPSAWRERTPRDWSTRKLAHEKRSPAPSKPVGGGIGGRDSERGATAERRAVDRPSQGKVSALSPRRSERRDELNAHRGKLEVVSDPAMWRHVPEGGRRAERRSEPRVQAPRVTQTYRQSAWHDDGLVLYHTHDHWPWFWYDDPFWFGHTHVFVFRRGYGHLFHDDHRGFGHHHRRHLHHGFFHDLLFHHHGHIHFVILVDLEPVYGLVPVYAAPAGWVIEERDVPDLVGRRVPGAVYAGRSCAILEIVNLEGSVLRIAVDPADFGAENVGQLRDVLEEALAATGQLDLEDLAGVRHVIPRSSIEAIRGTACGVD